MRIALTYEDQSQPSALVVGYGFIGQQDVRRLSSLRCDAGVCSRRAVDVQTLFSKLTQTLAEFAPNYVVLTSQTHEHVHNLQDLAAANFTEPVLVEKPLLDHQSPLPDNRLSEMFERMPTSQKNANETGKHFLKKWGLKFFDEDLMFRKKSMPTMPIGEWIRGQLKDWALNTLTELDPNRYNVTGALALLREHNEGKVNRKPALCTLLISSALLTNLNTS